VVGHRVEGRVNQPGWVVVLLWEAGGAGVFDSQEDNGEVVLGIGKTRGLGPKECDDLDVVTPASLVAEGLESDPGPGGGGEGLIDDARGLAPSCPATRHGFIWRQTSGCRRSLPHRS
jgi:hypothetical protein